MKRLILPIAVLLTASAQTVVSVRHRVASGGGGGTSYGNGFSLFQQTGTANAGAGATSVATLSGNATVGHKVLIFGYSCNDSGCGTDASAITLSASASGAGNTPVACPGNPYRVGTNKGVFGCWIMDVSTATAAFTVTATGGTPYYLTTWASEWGGIAAAASAFDVAFATEVTAAETATVTTATTTNATDLVVGFIELSDGYAITPGSGFTEIGEFTPGVELEAQSVTATGAQSCTWSWTGATNSHGLCVAFKGQ